MSIFLRCNKYIVFYGKCSRFPEMGFTHSLFIKHAEHPLNKALQQSNLEVINAWINISAFDIESIGLSLDIFLK